MALTGSINFGVTLDNTTSLDLSTPTERVIPQSATQIWTVVSGTGADQMDQLWHDQRTIAGSGTDDLDLAGVLTDAYGATLTFVKLKFLYVYAAAANGDTLAIGAAASNPISTLFGATNDKLNIRPDGTFMLIAPDATGYAVTAGAADILRVTNNDGSSVVYDIVIGGTSA